MWEIILFVIANCCVSSRISHSAFVSPGMCQAAISRRGASDYFFDRFINLRLLEPCNTAASRKTEIQQGLTSKNAVSIFWHYHHRRTGVSDICSRSDTDTINTEHSSSGQGPASCEAASEIYLFCSGHGLSRGNCREIILPFCCSSSIVTIILALA